MAEEYYINAQELLENSYRLGAPILESQFRPDFIVGIWRGGSPVGIAVQKMLQYFGVTTDHISVRTSLYTSITTSDKQVRVHGLDYLINNLNAEYALLIADDVYDSGRSIRADQQKNPPQHTSQIKMPHLWYKPTNNETDREPDYFLHAADKWLVFPHGIMGLSRAELKSGKGKLFDIIGSVSESKKG